MVAVTEHEADVPRICDARPDTPDFRDRVYEPTLVEVPPRIDLEAYRALGVPILDQLSEGACTGFGLASLANYLLRQRRVAPDHTAVSARMFYEMAKRYDEWPGQGYEGSSARAAMKGWHKHGVCADEIWPYDPAAPDCRLTGERSINAIGRPLGAYYRVNHMDLVAMHSALAEVGVLYATALVHEGWQQLGPGGEIPFKDDFKVLGAHAFVLVAYDERGFWLQNSWGAGWGLGGFALVTYDDWLSFGRDVWVARLGAPVQLRTAQAAAITHSVAAAQSETYSYCELRAHIISIGNDGRPRPTGPYGTSGADVSELLEVDFPRITKGWRKKRLLLYAHGGLTEESSAVQRLAEYRPAMLEAEIYPLAFIWKTDLWTTLTNILEDAVRRVRPEGRLDAALDFMLDRIDDALEPLARAIGKGPWDEMKENARLATECADGGARLVVGHLADLLAAEPEVEVHVVGHSAGGIFHAPLIQLLTTTGEIASGPMRGQMGHGRRVATCTLWAPACSVELFRETYLSAIRGGGIGRFTLFTLTDEAEQDDHVAHKYSKSLLYLVANALEDQPRIPLLREQGVPILGMEKFVRGDPELTTLFESGKADWILSPNGEPDNSPEHSTSHRHGDFDDDPATLRATLARVLGVPAMGARFSMSRSASSLRAKRLQLSTYG
jgi:hypothetical protein